MDGDKVAKLIETDQRGRVTLPVSGTHRYLVEMRDDGSMLLIPAKVMTQAQYEYETNVALKQMLDQAMSEPTLEGEMPRRRRAAS